MKMFTCVVLVLLPLFLCLVQCNPHDKIALSDRYDYVIIGSDHVSPSLGLHLTKRSRTELVLVLQANRCADILEPDQFEMLQAPQVEWCDQDIKPKSDLDMLGLNVSNKFAEVVQQMGYQFVEPFSAGTQVGCAYKNRTCKLDTEHTVLLAVEPNLKLLTGVTVVRLLFNHAASSVLGVEIELDGSNQYIYVNKEVIIAGRCLNNYRHLITTSIMTETTLFNFLHTIPSEISLPSPLLAPILYTLTKTTFPQNTTLLATELFLRVAEGQEDGESEPNARLRMIIGDAHSDGYLWVGFIPALFSDDPHYLPSYERTVKILSHVAKVAVTIINCSAFKQLNLAQFNQSVPECVKFEGSAQFWTCYIDIRLKLFEKKVNDNCYNVTQLDDHFRLNGVKALRLLPLGLSAPFLNQLWNKLFPGVDEDSNSTTGRCHAQRVFV